MEKQTKQPTNDLGAQIRMSDIIRTHSTNTQDIRTFALMGLDFSKVRNILDIGSGYGYFVMALKNRLKKNTHIVGIDIKKNYQKPFLEAVKTIGAHGEFHISDAIEIASYPPKSFDLVLSSFSMYFCADAMQYIPNILTHDGIFIVITHSNQMYRELIPFLKETYKHFDIKTKTRTYLEELLNIFSAENGKKQLNALFKKTVMRKYHNTLEFTPENIDDFEFYLETKKHLIFEEVVSADPEILDDAVKHLVGLLKKEVREKEKIVLNKDDAVFICREPRTEKRAINILSEKRFCTYCGKELVERMIECKKRKLCMECGHIVYENPLPIVSVVTVNEQGEVLLVKRANQPMKGMWCLPGGFAESDESIDEAALRELEEETGLKGKITRVLLVETTRNYFYGNLITVTYEAEIAHGKLQAGDDAEETAFFPLDNIPALAFSSHEHAITRYRQLLA